MKSVDLLRFTLPGTTPSGKNAVLITRTGQRYPAPRFKKWRDSVMPILQPLASPGPLLSNNLSIEVLYWPGDLRRRDVPGMVDALFHVIEKAGIVRDDAQLKHVHFWTQELDRTNPRVEVSLW